MSIGGYGECVYTYIELLELGVQPHAAHQAIDRKGFSVGKLLIFVNTVAFSQPFAEEGRSWSLGPLSRRITAD